MQVIVQPQQAAHPLRNFSPAPSGAFCLVSLSHQSDGLREWEKTPRGISGAFCIGWASLAAWE